MENRLGAARGKGQGMEEIGDPVSFFSLNKLNKNANNKTRKQKTQITCLACLSPQMEFMIVFILEQRQQKTS